MFVDFCTLIQVHKVLLFILHYGYNKLEKDAPEKLEGESFLL